MGGLRVKGRLGGPVDPKWGEVGREELGTWRSQLIPPTLGFGMIWVLVFFFIFWVHVFLLGCCNYFLNQIIYLV